MKQQHGTGRIMDTIQSQRNNLAESAAPRNGVAQNVAPISPFTFEGCDVRVITGKGGEPWFVAKDVADLLGYANPQKAVRDHCKGAIPVGVNDSFGLDPQTILIPERDVYRLVMRSHMPAAERFEEWVVGEVLPSIRRTGSYSAKMTAQLPHDYISALEHLLESKRSEQAAIAQRDHAITTKALIGNRREATAMATASSAKRESIKAKQEAAELRDQLGFSTRHATVLSVNSATRGVHSYIGLRRWCKEHDVTPETVPDKRYDAVKAWPAAAWMAVYGISLGNLFGGVQ